MKKILFLLLLLISIAASAETYYVSTTGNNGANGLTPATSWATLAYATSTVTYGDTIWTVAGVHVPPATINLPEGVHLTGDGVTAIIRPSTALNPIINLQSPAEGTDGNQSISNIQIDGDLVAVRGVEILGRSNVSIHNVTVIDMVEMGIFFTGRNVRSEYEATIYATGNKVYNCTITNCGYDYYNVGANAYWAIGACLHINSQQGALVYNNTFDNLTGGRYCYTMRGQHHKGNKVYDNTMSTQLRTDDGIYSYTFNIEFWTGYGGIEVYNNILNGAIDFGGYGWSDAAGYGFAIKCYGNTVILPSQETYNSHHGESGIILESGSSGGAYIYHNYVSNFAQGVSLSVTAASLVPGMNNIWVYYNILTNIGYTTGGAGSGIGGYAGEDAVDDLEMNNIYLLNNVIHKTNKTSGWGIVYEYNLANKLKWYNLNIKNNIIYNAYSPIMFIYQDCDVLNIQNNILYEYTNVNPIRVFYGTVTNYTESGNQLGVDPEFVGGSPYSYKIQDGSPARDAGISVGLTTDYGGYSVPVGPLPDIGAWEWGADVTPPNWHPTGLGWDDIYFKNNFRDTVNFTVPPTIAGAPLNLAALLPSGLTATVNDLNATTGATGNLQGQINAIEASTVDDSKADTSLSNLGSAGIAVISGIVHDSLAAVLNNADDGIAVTDTADMLAPYALLSEVGEGGGLSSGDVAAQINDSIDARLAVAAPGVKVSDTTAMLAPYFTEPEIRKVDSDTIPLFIFGTGSGATADTALFNNTRLIGSFYNSGSDTLHITELRGVMKAGTGTETIDVQIAWHATLLDGSATVLNTNAVTILSITTGTADTSFDNNDIPPGVWVWGILSGASTNNKPTYLCVTLTGYKRNRSY